MFGLLAAITYYVSYLYGASTTLEELSAGKFGTEPFIPIPKETYRLWESFFILPMYITAWFLLSCSAYLSGKALGGKTTFGGTLNVLGFSYFIPLYLFVAVDFFLIGPAYAWNLAAMRGLYGPGTQRWVYLLGVLYIALPFGLWAPVLTYCAVRTVQKLNAWKAIAVTIAALIPPNAFFSFFIR